MDMKHDFWQLTARTIAISIILGGASGVLTSALTSSYLSDYAIQLSELTEPLRSGEERPTAFPGSYSEAVQNFENNTIKSVATFYLKSAKGIYGFDSTDKVASGSVLTSDGWIAVSGATSSKLFSSSVQVKDNVYNVEEVVFDKDTNIAFVKIDASGLSVVSFGSGLDVSLGEQLLTTSGAGEFNSTVVLEKKWPKGVVVSSDKPARRISLDTKTIETGSSVFDLSGALVGFYVKEGNNLHMLPIDGILPSLSSVLKDKKIIRPKLGVQYIDISHSVGLTEKTTRENRYGAYLTGRPAVKNNSPAALAGLRAGDIILEINNQNVNGHRGLDEIIFSYKPGDKLEFVIDRAGEELIKEVTLGE
jgi:serine protease Do